MIAFNKKVSSNKGSGLNLVGGTATIKNTLLVDNVGDTFTHKLLDGSPAIDKAINDGCPSTDQRGFIRPFDFNTIGTKVCDIGAYEAWIDRNDVAIASMTVLPPAVVSTDGGGGGCSAADGQRPVDPVLPALGVLGLLGWALRRVRRG